MNMVENLKPNALWFLSILILAIMVMLPGSPFPLSVFIPILAVRFLPKFKLEIVFLYAIIFGITFSNNFFSAHLYSFKSNDPELIVSGMIYAGNSLNSMGQFFSHLMGFVLYLLIFVLIFKVFKKLFKEITLASSIFLSLTLLGILWISQVLLHFDNKIVFVVCLASLMMARHAFYLFNYVRFFNVLPKNRHEASAMIQPFWFLISAAPENPIYQIEKNATEKNDNLKGAAYIFITCVLFKMILTCYMSIVSFVLTKKFAFVIDDVELINTLVISIFKNWRNENVARLFICLFSSSVSYLGTTFFIYGRVGIGMARLCGFNLPDYINSPWKSQSFADFFSRIMYYYNIIIVNHFFYPALEFLRRFNLSRKQRVFIGINWALIFGGFISHFLKDAWKIYKFGFLKALGFTSTLALPAIVALSVSVSLSLYFQKKTTEKKTNIPRMVFYFFLYSLIMPLNFSIVFGDFQSVIQFYVKVLTFGLFSS